MKIIYDIISFPRHTTYDKFMKMVEEDKLVIWDSSLGGKAPTLVPDVDLEIKDISKDLTS